MKYLKAFTSCLFAAFFLFCVTAQAQETIISSPDGKMNVAVFLKDSSINYRVIYNGKLALEDAPLGLVTTVTDFSKSLVFKGRKDSVIDEQYSLDRIKQSQVHYQANEAVLTYANKSDELALILRVSNHNIAIKYSMPKPASAASCVVLKELTAFHFPKQTTTFLTPQATPMIGWEKTKPSYEEEYEPDATLGKASKYGVGFTFPALFHEGRNGWVLVSETGVTSKYCGSKLSEPTTDGTYSIAFPELGENNGVGSANPALALPGETPWRTITIGETLKPIVETTIPFDVVSPRYAPSQQYKYGRSTWSWIEWQDNSMNYDDQVTFIDLAARLGYEYILVDALWESQVGRDRMPALFKYAQSKGVNIFLWYNSNGYWNNAPQDPKQRMSSSIARRAEMKWLQSLGVKGLKVDFFGGDKQETMKLYEDILVDANEFGLMVIFHGCTLPRGWEKMYPNYIASEAVLASENLIFNQHFDDMEAFNASLHPFIRNAVGSMDFGPVLLNKRHNRNNDGGTTRKTTDVFQLATAVLFQTTVQNFGITPNNLPELPAFEIDFMKQVPTTWDETKFIDGYPGKYCILARRHGDTWYVVGVNAGKEPLQLNLELPMLGGKNVSMYSDNADRSAKFGSVKPNAKGAFAVTLQPDGGVILVGK